MPITLDLTPEQIARYRASAHKRYQREKADVEHRREFAWQAAKQATHILRRQYHATRVVAFGSLVQEAGFTRWSDVDMLPGGLRLKIRFLLLVLFQS